MHKLIRHVDSMAIVFVDINQKDNDRHCIQNVTDDSCTNLYSRINLEYRGRYLL